MIKKKMSLIDIIRCLRIYKIKGCETEFLKRDEVLRILTKGVKDD